MRSELVFAAMEHVPNRFFLTKLASTAARKFHRPNTRMQETINAVLERFGKDSRISSSIKTEQPQKSEIVRPLRRVEKAPARRPDQERAVA